MPFHRSLFGRHRDKEWWNAWDYPSRIFDQKFGVALRDEDLFDRDPFARRPLSTLSLSSPRRGQASNISLRMECRLFSNDTIKTLSDVPPFPPPLPTHYVCAFVFGLVSGGACDVVPRSTGVSEVVNDDSKFEVRLDVSFFNPNDITVKVLGTDSVLVHGKHEERQDEHGFVSREFTRRYMLPPDVDPEQVSSEFLADEEGVLVIRAAKKSPEPAALKERVVPIAVLSPNKAKA
ncbi:hypothetical protein HPB51_018416 [Rhipicephalus microplus]|uniref:SHSP domain-containing protein n=1 Tax=Rhipicephalus microplus TaxID=6941 RepID=A0A9J6EUZ4_RHIMP|nr:hypothetical protein HPB51_018416 [Rhipicephalus microplus]